MSPGSWRNGRQKWLGGDAEDRSQALVPLETRPGPWWEVLRGHGLTDWAPEPMAEHAG